MSRISAARPSLPLTARASAPFVVTANAAVVASWSSTAASSRQFDAQDGPGSRSAAATRVSIEESGYRAGGRLYLIEQANIKDSEQKTGANCRM
jgi:hypothetical protein